MAPTVVDTSRLAWVKKKSWQACIVRTAREALASNGTRQASEQKGSLSWRDGMSRTSSAPGRDSNPQPACSIECAQAGQNALAPLVLACRLVRRPAWLLAWPSLPFSPSAVKTPSA